MCLSMFKTTMSTFASTTGPLSTQEGTEQDVEIISKNNELQVFLGGSCNPTTWRQNLAIPFLEMNGISYYNPQIDNWTPEVVELEHRAKQDAQVLLFVIDDQTRATVTLIESAYLAADDKNIVFVFYPFESNMSCSPEQSLEAYNLYESRQRTMKTSLTTAKNSISMVCTASSESSSSSLSSSTSMSHRTSPAFRLASIHSRTSKSSFALTEKEKEGDDNFSDFEARQRLEHLANCSLRLAGESISVEEFRELKQARSILKNLIDMRKIPTFPDIPRALNHISCHIRGTIHRNTDSSSWCDSEPYLSNFQQSTTESIKYCTGHNVKSQITDVYLSLDSEDRTIMETTVIPLLKSSGLSYNYMSMKDISDSQKSTDNASTDYTQRLACIQDDCENELDKAMRLLPDRIIDKAELAIDKELYAIRTSKVLLFVITSKCRGLSIMVLASHFMALLRDNVVLCVQYLEEPCTIGGEKLSKTAIADYNRGRVYLCDDAVKSRVPVFSTIREAIECCSRKCQDIK